jgi:hypothetical protein
MILHHADEERAFSLVPGDYRLPLLTRLIVFLVPFIKAGKDIVVALN